MKKETIKGDLLKLAREGNFDAIIQGCNCFCRMGAGIAAQIAKEYPEAYDVDKKTVAGDKSKLGNYTKVMVETNNKPFYIINAYTQYGHDGRLKGEMDVDYEAVRNVMHKINKDFKEYRIGYPLIGAGLAGGDWNIIARIIDHELIDVEHTLVEYDPNL